MQLRKTFAENLRRVRLARPLSQEALANEAGIDRTYVSSLERGIYSPTLDMLEKLALVLGVEPVELVTPLGRKRR